MTAAAQTSFGAVLRLADTGESVAVVAELTNVDPPTPTRNAVNVTTHDSTDDAMEFIADGVYDPGEINFQGFYIAGSDGDDALLGALINGTMQNFEIDLPAADGGKERMSGSAIVTSYGPDGQEIEGAATMSGTLKVSGPILQAAVSASPTPTP